MIIYHQELKAFNISRVKYIIVGGIAFNLLGGMRSTADLDILVDMTDNNLSKIVNILGKLGYKVLQPIDPLDIINQVKRKKLIKDKNMKTLTFLKENTLNQVDIIFDSPVSFAKALKSVILLKIDGIRLPVVGINELVLMKKVAWRSIDQADIAELKIIKKLKA